MRDFDVKVIAFDMVARIMPVLLASIDSAKLEGALNVSFFGHKIHETPADCSRWYDLDISNCPK